MGLREMEGLLAEALERVFPLLEGDRGELRRRLGRMEGRFLSRPPRGTCIVIRAGDTRLEEELGYGTGERRRFKLLSFKKARRKAGDYPHTDRLCLTKGLLERLTAPVRIDGLIHPVEAANLLGVSLASIIHSTGALGYSGHRKQVGKGEHCVVFRRVD